MIKTFLKCKWLNLWWHAALVILAATVLVGLSGYKIVGLPLLCIYGIGDGHPSLMDKTIGVLLLVLFAAIALYVAYLTIALFVRLIFSKTRSKAFRSVLFMGLMLIFAANVFALWKTNHKEWQSNAVYWAVNAARENDDPTAYEAALKQSKSIDLEMELRKAAFFGKLKIVQYLISKGTNPNAMMTNSNPMITNLSDSILDEAYNGGNLVSNRNKAVIEFLIGHGATNCDEGIKKFYESLP